MFIFIFHFFIVSDSGLVLAGQTIGYSHGFTRFGGGEMVAVCYSRCAVAGGHLVGSAVQYILVAYLFYTK